jgi:hypothetical protein
MADQFVEEQTGLEEVKKIDFERFMFGDFGSRRRKAPVLNEIESTNTEEESPSIPQKASKPQNLKRKNTVSGKFIISRYWEDNNMCEFWVRRISS